MRRASGSRCAARLLTSSLVGGDGLPRGDGLDADPPLRAFLFILAAIFAGSCVLASYHAGVEWHWWRGPEGCTASGGGVNASQMAAFLSGARTQSGPMCDQAAWTMFGLSMAGYNALISLGLTAVSLWVAIGAK